MEDGSVVVAVVPAAAAVVVVVVMYQWVVQVFKLHRDSWGVTSVLPKA